LLLPVGLVFVALPAGPGLADTTIGQVGFGGGGNFACGPGVIGDPNYVVPLGRRGRITSFSFQSASNNAGQQLDFLVLRSAGGSNYTVIGKTGVVTLKGTGPEPETSRPALSSFTAETSSASGAGFSIIAFTLAAAASSSTPLRLIRTSETRSHWGVASTASI
jgi:hypothetical protein